MTAYRVEPRGEKLRRAVRCLSQCAAVTRDSIHEAAARFDLSPVEAEFLIPELPKTPE